MKTFLRRVHLYLGLAAGLVIAVLCFTGAVLVFEKELEQALHPDRYRVAVPAGAPRRPLAELVAAVQQAAGSKAKIASVKVYADPARTVEIGVAGGEGPGRDAGRARPAAEAGGQKPAPRGEKGGGGEGGGPKYFANPYTGQLVGGGAYNYRDTFFFKTMALHRGMVAGAPGKLLVGVSTALFLVILLTGLVLWVPATGRALRQRLTVKWNASWKRLNHDLHVVLGFYAAVFLFAFAFTGLAWSFEWFNKGIFWLTNSEMKGPEPPAAPAAAGAPAPAGFDALYAAARQRAPTAQSYALQLPREAGAVARVNVLPADAAHESAADELYFDPATARPLGQLRYAERNLGQRVRRTFKPVHTGAVFGLAGKVLALTVCVLGVTFPVTGFVMWRNRVRKERRVAGRRAAAAPAAA